MNASSGSGECPSVKVSVSAAAMNDAIRAAKCRNELFALRSWFR
jgi:hypothetical protein